MKEHTYQTSTSAPPPQDETVKLGPKVLIIQETLPHYRVPFFEHLKTYLNQRGISLRLFYGKGNKEQQKKKDTQVLEWAERKDGQYFTLLNKATLVWQPALREAMKSDLVIVEQANKHLINYLLLANRRMLGRSPQFAFWGHGRNYQEGKEGLSSRVKSALLDASDWWFAYTQGVREELIQKGVKADKITSVNNSIDTIWQSNSFANLSKQQVEAFREEHFPGLDPQKTAIYCGGLYEQKRLPFMIEACKQIQAQVPGFQMIIVGSGEDAYLAEQAAAQHEWLHYVGPKFGEEKLLHFKMANLLLIPGLVGLAVLDAFSFQTPLVTTDYEFHSPEITYVDNGINGIITRNDVSAYADAVVHLLGHPEEVARLRAGCEAAVQNYSIEKMARLFGEGIIQALSI